MAKSMTDLLNTATGDKKQIDPEIFKKQYNTYKKGNTLILACNGEEIKIDMNRVIIISSERYGYMMFKFNQDDFFEQGSISTISEIDADGNYVISNATWTPSIYAEVGDRIYLRQCCTELLPTGQYFMCRVGNMFMFRNTDGVYKQVSKLSIITDDEFYEGTWYTVMVTQDKQYPMERVSKAFLQYRNLLEYLEAYERSMYGT